MNKPLPRYTEDTDPHKLDRIIGPDTDTPPPKQLEHRAGEGDQQRMRSIPIIAQGIPGTIPNTEGYAALHAKERWALRFKARRVNRA